MKIYFRKPKEEHKRKIRKLLESTRRNYVAVRHKYKIDKEIEGIYSKKLKPIIALNSKDQVLGLIEWKKYRNNHSYGWINHLIVHPKFRGHDVGIKLRRKAFEEIRRKGLKGVYSRTWHKNQPMININLKMGMKVVKRYTDDRWGKGNKSIIFRKTFKSK